MSSSGLPPPLGTSLYSSSLLLGNCPLSLLAYPRRAPSPTTLGNFWLLILCRPPGFQSYPSVSIVTLEGQWIWPHFQILFKTSWKFPSFQHVLTLLLWKPQNLFHCLNYFHLLITYFNSASPAFSFHPVRHFLHPSLTVLSTFLIQFLILPLTNCPFCYWHHSAIISWGLILLQLLIPWRWSKYEKVL